jgi:HlyD family secretion protein
VWSKPDVLKIPASSLFRDETQWAVYKVIDGEAVRTSIEIGQRSGLEAEVLSGLQAGDQIVVYPSDAIQQGVKVVPRS